MKVNKINESGRSMVEMLGVLAIVGILSVGGVVMYRTAMNKHRANELLNEANQRAVVVSSQILMNNRIPSDDMLVEFTNPTGYTFGVGEEIEDKFYIQITADNPDIYADICTQMKAAINVRSPIRKINTDCTKLIFNNDLSNIVYPSDYNDDTTGNSCTDAGFRWCSAKGDNGTCISDATCCEDVTVDECQTCNDNTGAVTNKSEGEFCTFNGVENAGICNSFGECEEWKPKFTRGLLKAAHYCNTSGCLSLYQSVSEPKEDSVVCPEGYHWASTSDVLNSEFGTDGYQASPAREKALYKDATVCAIRDGSADDGKACGTSDSTGNIDSLWLKGCNGTCTASGSAWFVFWNGYVSANATRTAQYYALCVR